MSSHPVNGLDDVVHQRVRLGILTIAHEARQVEFGYLRTTLELTGGNLSQHLATLENAGLITISKGYEGKRPRTWVSLTTFFAYQTEDQKITENCGVPASASAAILNITVVPQNNWQGGFLTIYPAGTGRPEVSQVSYNWANITGEVTAKLGPQGSVTIFNGSPGTADVIVDVAAYIAG